MRNLASPAFRREIFYSMQIKAAGPGPSKIEIPTSRKGQKGCVRMDCGQLCPICGFLCCHSLVALWPCSPSIYDQHSVHLVVPLPQRAQEKGAQRWGSSDGFGRELCSQHRAFCRCGRKQGAFFNHIPAKSFLLYSPLSVSRDFLWSRRRRESGCWELASSRTQLITQQLSQSWAAEGTVIWCWTQAGPSRREMHFSRMQEQRVWFVPKVWNEYCSWRGR